MPITTTAQPFPKRAGLAEFVKHLSSTEQACAISPDGRQAWFPSPRGILCRLPFECTEPAEPVFVRRLLRQKNVWLVNYLAEPGPGRIANCFDYVCRDKEYCIDKLSSPARRDIRRGLRTFSVRMCSWDELAEKGLPAHNDTQQRHGYLSPDPQGFRTSLQSLKNRTFYHLWGAWQGENMAAWMAFIRIDDWAIIGVARSCTDALRGCPNNALLYEATRHFMINEHLTYITYGVSSLQVDANEYSMHRYKTRMGYQAIPMCRVFQPHPLLYPVLKSSLLSRTWERLSRSFPKSARLRKLAGMSRLISGRVENPLEWAQPRDDEE